MRVWKNVLPVPLAMKEANWRRASAYSVVIPDKRRSRADPGPIPEDSRHALRNGFRVSAALRPG